MLGLFDSGTGGLNTVKYLKEAALDCDLIYLIDRNNAPYGIKSEKEILEITKNNIEVLTGMGAERVLIACCTASTVYNLLPKEYKIVSIPIIDEIAKEAKKHTRGRIGVIATERTVSSHAFKAALKGLYVSELALGKLVTAIDGGLCDDTVTDADILMIEQLISPVLTANIDTLILGCTHFPALIRTIGDIASKYGNIHLIDSARVGADRLIKRKMKNI